MKQTAVEWLEKRFYFTKGQLIDIDFEQAKKMEKEHIVIAGNSCALKQHILNRKLDTMSLEELEKFAEEEVITFGEQYYNETFKK